MLGRTVDTAKNTLGFVLRSLRRRRRRKRKKEEKEEKLELVGNEKLDAFLSLPGISYS